MLDVPDARAAAVMKAAPLRVVSISHSAVRSGAARMRYEALARDPDVDLTLIVPKFWQEPGQAAEHGEASRTTLRVRVERARLTRGGPAKWYLHHYPGLRRALRDLRPDVIHLWEEPWSVVALQAVRLRARVAPEAAIVLETDQNILRRLPPGFEQLRRFTLARTDLLIARGREALDVSEACGFAGPSEFVMYGVDTRSFFPRDRGAARPPGALRIGYVGRLVPEKGLFDVLDAVAASRADVTWALLGDGPDRAALIARAQALGIGGRVEFLAPRDAAGVADFMTSVDAIVLMSRTTRTWKEQFGRVIMEAHACGTPVIGSSSGSIPSVTGRGGWIVPEGDASALAGLLDRLAHAPEAVRAAGEAGRADVARRFGFDVVSADLRRAWVRAAAVRRERSA